MKPALTAPQESVQMITTRFLLHNTCVNNTTRPIDCCVILTTTTAIHFFAPVVMGFDVIYKE